MSEGVEVGSSGPERYRDAPPDTRMVRVALVGLLAGFTSGLFGVGGGVVIVPGLAMLAQFPHKLATGTSLTAIVPISIAGLVGYAIEGEVDAVAALLIAAGALVGAVGGTSLLVRLRSQTLQFAFAGLLLVTAVRMFVEDGDGDGRGALTVAAAVALVLIGLASGLLAGMFGVGGGILVVPALTIGFGLPLALAKGTSLLVIVPTALMGTVRNRRAGLTELRPAAAVGVAGIASAFLASLLSVNLDPTVAAVTFAVFLLLVSVRLAVSARVRAPSP